MKQFMYRTFPILAWVLIAVVVATAAAVLWIAIDVRYFNKAKPPVEYSASVYSPEKAVYAPGETLRYTPTLTLRRETQISGVRIIVSASTRRTALLCDGTPALPIVVMGGAEEGTEANIDGSPFVPIPIPNLPPGDYWVRSFIHGFGESTGQATYRVLFKIEKPC